MRQRPVCSTYFCNDPRKWLFALLFLLMAATGCLHRKVPAPQFGVRKCPIDSLPYQAVYNGVLLNHGELCMAINPVTNRPMGVFAVQEYNPYTETDRDDDAGDTKPKKASWWKFWKKRKDGDKDDKDRD
jgi:hypothetical protein